MSVWENVGGAIGKAAQSAMDAIQEIGDAAQGAAELRRNEKREKDAVNAGKCPKCGQPLNGISATCPTCGYELRDVRLSGSIGELTKEIERIEQRRNVIVDSISAKVSSRNPTDEKVASVIRNFVIPNTKEDIFEFMIHAAGNMDAKVLAGRERAKEISEVVMKAWDGKFRQAYQKAKLSFGGDADFRKIQEFYDKKMQEIEDAKPRSIFGRRK